jgi:protein SCO1/2
MASRTGTIGLLLAGLTAVVLVAVLVLRPDPELPGVVRDPAPDVHGLTFQDVWQREEAVTADLVPAEGELTLAYFGYLSCPDMCPLTMGDLRRARQLIGEELSARTTVAFVTLDPGRDDPERLNAYLSLFFDDRVLALTAPDAAALDAAAAQLGVRFELEEPDADGRYEVQHSAITYVIDDRGVVVRELPFGVPAEDVARVIEATLRERS